MVRKKVGIRRKPRIKKRPAKYVLSAESTIDYKNIDLVKKYLTDRGKLLSRRLTGVTAPQQRDLTRAVKRLRFLGLLPVGSAKRRAIL